MDSDTTSHNNQPSPDSQVPWFEQPQFHRYWQHYQSVWSWYWQHLEAVKNVSFHSVAQDWYQWQLQTYMYMHNYMLQMYSQRVFPPLPLSKHRMQNDTNSQRDSPASHQNHIKKKIHKHNRKRKSLQNLKAYPNKMSPKYIAIELTDEDCTEFIEEGEEFEMEITDAMLEFFAHSARHRKERDIERKDLDDGEDHVPLGEATIASKRTTVLPPSERPGIKRTTEMRYLYGKGAAMIHGMETAVQLTFDRNSDLRQPKLWPNIPLSIKFK